MPLRIVRGDITRCKASAIVNSARSEVAVGSGVDKAVYKAAGGEALLALRRHVGTIATGEAVSTAALRLKADFIIHTVAPVWQEGEAGEREALECCWRHSLDEAARCGCKSLAAPLLGSGTCGFPKEEAVAIALKAIDVFLLSHDMQVSLVIFAKGSLALSGETSSGLRSYISSRKAASKHTAKRQKYETAGLMLSPTLAHKEHKAPPRRLLSYDEAPVLGVRELEFAASAPSGIEDVLARAGETFQERLFRLIGESGMSEVEVYTRANLDRRLFSKIRCNPHYQPKKKTALAFAVALRLSLDETKDLIGRAGFALSPSSKADLIVEYFITGGNYNIFDINLALFDYEQPILGT